MKIIDRIYIDGINPQPWEAAEFSIGRKGGKLTGSAHSTMQQRAYQSAIFEDMTERGITPDQYPGANAFRFYFWRQIDTIQLPSGKTKMGHTADATNLLKATEDALQGILYENDRNNVLVESYIVSQSPTTIPCIVIAVGMADRVDAWEANGLLVAQPTPSTPSPRILDGDVPF